MKIFGKIFFTCTFWSFSRKMKKFWVNVFPQKFFLTGRFFYHQLIFQFSIGCFYIFYKNLSDF